MTRPPVRLTEEEWRVIYRALGGLYVAGGFVFVKGTPKEWSRVLRKIGVRGKLAATRGVAAVKGTG